MDYYKIWGARFYIIIAALVVVIGVQNISWPQAEAVEYVAPCSSLECEIEGRADAILQRDMPKHREMARLEAIREMNHKLYDMVNVSPHVDYDEVRAVVANMEE